MQEKGIQIIYLVFGDYLLWEIFITPVSPMRRIFDKITPTSGIVAIQYSLRAKAFVWKKILQAEA